MARGLSATLAIEILAANTKRMAPLRPFKSQYGRRAPMGYRSSGPTLGILLKLHTTFGGIHPLSRVTDAIENEEFRNAPIRIKGTPLMTGGGPANRSSDFNTSDGSFVRAVGTLLLAYA